MRVVIKNWRFVVRLDAGRRTETCAEVAFKDAPSVVAAIHNRSVHLLPRSLSDVRDPLLTADAIEAEAPRVAESEGSGRVHVDPEDFSE